MASLGRLTIDMVANLGGFERDMGKADRVTRQTMRRVSRELNRAERDADRAARTIRNLGLQLAAISAVGIAAVTREFRNMAAQADNIAKLATATGVTAEELQRLGFAAEQSGSNLETVARSVTQLQRNIQNASDGLASYNRAFERIGVTIEELQGLTPDQQFRRIAQALSEVGDAGVRNATALELFGRAGRELLPLLSRGAEGIEELGDQFERTGAIISGETARDFERFNDAINLLRQNAQALRVSVLSDLIGPLADFVDFLNTERGTAVMREALDNLRTAAIALGGILAGRFLIQLTAATSAFIAAQVQIARLTTQKLALQGASIAAARAVAGLRIAISTLLGPVGIALAVIGAIAPALMTVRREFRETAAESDSLADRFDRLTQSASQFRVEQLQGLLQEITAEQEAAARKVEAAAIRLAEARDRFNQTGDARAGAAILELSQELDNASREYDDLADKARVVGKRIAEALEPAKNGLKEIDTAAELAKRQLEQFRRTVEDVADALDGAESQAIRRFNRQVEQANQLLAQGKIGFEEYAAAIDVFRRQLTEALERELPDFADWVDGITDGLTAGRREIERYAEAIRRLGLTVAGGVSGFDFGSDRASDPQVTEVARTFRDAAIDGIVDGVDQAFRRIDANFLLSAGFGEIGRLIGRTVLESVGQQFGQQLGQQVGESLGQRLGTEIGGQIGGQLGGPIGQIIGSLIGSRLFGDKDPKFQLGGTTGFAQTGGTARGQFESALGATLFRFRDVEDAAARQIQDALVQFDSTIAALIADGPQLQAIQDALRNFAFDSADEGATIQDVLEQRFSLILGTFDAFTQSLVRQGAGLEEQAQRLGDILGIRESVALRGALRFDSADAVIASVAELNRGGETLGQTFDRISGIITNLVDADELVSEAARLAQERAAGFLAQIGIDAAELGGQELKDLFNDLFGTLGPDDTNILLRAGEAIVDLIDAEEELARLRGENVQDATAIAREREQIERRLLELQGDVLAIRQLELAAVDDSNRALQERILNLQAEADRARILQGLEETIALTPLNDFQRELIGIQRQLRQNIAALNRTAQAAGNQAASELDLARAHEAAAVQVAAAIGRLEGAARSLVDQVFGTPLDAINSQIEALQRQSQGAQSALGGVNTALAGLIQFADSLLIGALSPLGSRNRLDEGLRQLRAASAAGDAQRVQQLANQVLQIGRERFASGSQFTDLFDEVQGIIRGTSPADQVQSVSIVSSPALDALFAERDRLEAEARERELKTLGFGLAQVVSDLAGATGDTFADVADRLGFDLLELAGRLGFDTPQFEDFLRGLQVDTDDIAAKLEGVGEEISESVRDFAERSIPVQERTAENTREIAVAVNRLIDAVRDGQAGDSRSLRTRVTP